MFTVFGTEKSRTRVRDFVYSLQQLRNAAAVLKITILKITI